MTKQKIIQQIKQYDTIIIHRHVRPDADAYGSQVGLKEILKQSFPQKKVYAVGEEDSALHFLARMDKISDDLYKEALVIVCDTANTARISDQRYSLGKKIIKIDHHPNHDPYGDLLWVDTSASSTSELIYELYLNGVQNGLQMNEEAARLIYAGIVGDTGRFLFPSTTKKTFRYAAELVAFPFDRARLYGELYTISADIARLRGYILQHFTLNNSGVSSVKLTKEILEKYNVTPIETGKLVSAVSDIEGVQAWVFFIEEENLIRVRLRSKGPVINELAEKYNGGGHPLAAGASVSSWEEADKLINELNDVCLTYTQL
ncbi:DHH family phosphoesterase [Virgibacillus sp. W0430]|uniref:DHH family phosphoesterase n=1 Tax=Virgibacillus sp. W0430 TaxID=3391580 RepID=UPI003F46D4FA